MKLSDAIALGRVLIKSSSGREWFPDGSGCARGMALEGCGIGRIASPACSANWDRFFTTWGWVVKPTGGFPCGCDALSIDTVFACISHLFDHHVFLMQDWTLDQLIDWIASVEPAEAPAAEPVVAEAEAVRA